MTDDLEVQAALAGLNDHQLAHDVGASFTCGEIEDLATIFRSAGGDEVAELWIAAHAEDDDEGDMHYQEPSASGATPADEAAS